mmetsp:Transcript_40689/g.128286  ORF Transcript_40689/g.128286 Transcript_40689/m.128286 type:complete len:204 (+) Transcript_40689:462-1073(+)
MIAAVKKVTTTGTSLRDPMAHKAPHANSRESPGRKGVTTKPVSAKTIDHRIAYVIVPYFAMIATSSVSRCSTNFTNFLIPEVPSAACDAPVVARAGKLHKEAAASRATAIISLCSDLLPLGFLEEGVAREPARRSGEAGETLRMLGTSIRRALNPAACKGLGGGNIGEVEKPTAWELRGRDDGAPGEIQAYIAAGPCLPERQG